MEHYTVKLTSKEEIAKGTTAFRFEKPEGYVFKAGQAAEWTLLNSPDLKDDEHTHTFSIASVRTNHS